jgi:hypothetical protein
MTPRARIERLVQAGTVAPEEGERLMAAIAAEPARSPLLLLIDPFDRFGGGVAAAVGLVVSTLSLAASRLGLRFDGFLDLHVARGRAPSLQVALLDQLVAWILPAACFWIYARLASRHVRWIDFVGMVGLARLPMLLGGVPIALLSQTLSQITIMTPRFTPALGGIAAIALGSVAWFITLLYQGFKNASGLQGPKLVGGFVAIVIVAETISKIAIVGWS